VLFPALFQRPSSEPCLHAFHAHGSPAAWRCLLGLREDLRISVPPNPRSQLQAACRPSSCTELSSVPRQVVTPAATTTTPFPWSSRSVGNPKFRSYHMDSGLQVSVSSSSLCHSQRPFTPEGPACEPKTSERCWNRFRCSAVGCG
jgi:hypothetical protein